MLKFEPEDLQYFIEEVDGFLRKHSKQVAQKAHFWEYQLDTKFGVFNVILVKDHRDYGNFLSVSGRFADFVNDNKPRDLPIGRVYSGRWNWTGGNERTKPVKDIQVFVNEVLFLLQDLLC
jgi:hypothetical protein